MDRSFIKFCTVNYPRVYKKVIKDYCLEKGKDESKTDLFIALLNMMDTELLDYCYMTALHYYQKKLNIQIWSDDQGNITII